MYGLSSISVSMSVRSAPEFHYTLSISGVTSKEGSGQVPAPGPKNSKFLGFIPIIRETKVISTPLPPQP